MHSCYIEISRTRYSQTFLKYNRSFLIIPELVMIKASLKSLRNQFMYPKPPFAHAYLGKYSSYFDSLLVDDDIITKLPRAPIQPVPCAMALVVFLPHPESQYIFWAPSNKNYQIPEVALVDFTPNWRQCEIYKRQ